jgi:hypothetical protein
MPAKAMALNTVLCRTKENSIMKAISNFRMGVLLIGRKVGHGIAVNVVSLGVPMSPKPHVPRHWTGHIRGLISTERTRSHQYRVPPFCVLATLC